MLLGVLVIAGPAAVLIGLALRAYRRSGSSAESWAAERELDLTDENRAMVAWYLRTSKTLRLLGVLAGFVLTPLVALALGDRTLGGAFIWFAAIGGYLVAIVYAEIALRRPAGQRASVQPRVLRDYLSPPALRAQRRTAIGIVAVAVLAVAVPMRAPETVSVTERGSVLVAVLVVFAAVEATQRWLIRRPRPVVSTPLREADDAIRIQSVHSIAGAGMGMQWLLGGAALWALAGSDVQLLRWTAWLPAIASWAIALTTCTRFDSGMWQVRRA